MNWRELVLSKVDTVVTLATATTGLRIEDGDELIAVSMVRLPKEGEPERVTLFRMVDKDKLVAAFEYHRVSESRMLYDSSSDDLFQQVLVDWLAPDVTVFTYNTEFQYTFLERHVPVDLVLYDLPLILRGIETRLPVDEDQVTSMTDIASCMLRRAGRAPAFKKLLAMYGISTDSSVLLPCESNAEALVQLFDKLEALPVAMQGVLL